MNFNFANGSEEFKLYSGTVTAVLSKQQNTSIDLSFTLDLKDPCLSDVLTASVGTPPTTATL